ncbi:hypothetical protein CBL_02845 [Carabus blaptoides fortunei]
MAVSGFIVVCAGCSLCAVAVEDFVKRMNSSIPVRYLIVFESLCDWCPLVNWLNRIGELRGCAVWLTVCETTYHNRPIESLDSRFQHWDCCRLVVFVVVGYFDFQ